ncbi:MAG: hypothetical protein BZ136_08290 [Methanosphaera sp. rholeuAM74]|nr:MAG: hypothetical protein BZ136_08290 [Methanosphaera sp. rholeuAM74]
MPAAAAEKTDFCNCSAGQLRIFQGFFAVCMPVEKAEMNAYYKIVKAFFQKRVEILIRMCYSVNRTAKGFTNIC